MPCNDLAILINREFYFFLLKKKCYKVKQILKCMVYIYTLELLIKCITRLLVLALRN